jgi:pilus assembly protein CpaF
MTRSEAAPAPDLVDRVRWRLAQASAGPLRTEDVVAALRAEGGLRSESETLEMLARLRSELAGAGPLQPLLADPSVTDVLVNGPDEVWIDRGEALERTSVRFPDAEAVRRLAERLVLATGRPLDNAHPYVDARLPDGSRVHAVLSPVAVGGPYLSLRVARRSAFTIDELTTAGSLPGDTAAVLRGLVRGRAAGLISGGTGTGKTTLLSALLTEVPPGERLVLVEDSVELRPAHPHVLRLEARPPNAEGAGEVTVRSLVRQALRMRPDRLVVGEVRGAEVVDMLGAMNTGHEGGWGTVHANAAGDVPARLEALGTAAGLSREAVQAQVEAAVDVVVHLVRDRDGLRRLGEIATLEPAAEPGGRIRVLPALTVERSGAGALLQRRAGWERLQAILDRAP